LVESVHRPAVATLALLSVLAVLPSASAFYSTAPLAPQNVTWHATDDGVEVTWDAPLYDGGDPILFYRVYRDGQLIADQVQDELYLDTEGLESQESSSATASTYAVTAVNSVGESFNDGAAGACVDTNGVSVPDCADTVTSFVFWVLDQVML
jgi:hypothetical protein